MLDHFTLENTLFWGYITKLLLFALDGLCQFLSRYLSNEK